MNNEMIVHNDQHPLMAKISKAKLPLFSRSGILSQRPQVVWDFTLGSTNEKRDFYKELRNLGVKTIHAEMSTCDGSQLIKEFPEVKSAFALACWSPKESYELWQREDDAEFGLLEIFPLEPLFVTTPGHCFTYPRVISTLINEARFAKKDNLAKDEDLDRAMKYGVNYPFGLLEWENKIGPEIITMILDELRQGKNSARYETI